MTHKVDRILEEIFFKKLNHVDTDVQPHQQSFPGIK